MKIKALIVLSWIFCLLSCSGDSYEIPDTSINPPEINGDTIDIATVKALLAQESGYFGSVSGDEQFSFKDTHLYMPGYVISSDETGNFYQELIVQDRPENPTSGIKVSLQVNPLFTRYEIGRKVYVELDGFTVGFSNGVIALGVSQAGNDFIDKAPRAFGDKIIRTTTKDSIIPLTIQIRDFQGREKEYEWENLFVEIADVQFTADDVLSDRTQTFAGEPEDFYDATHVLENCEEGSSTQLLTSTFSDFKSLYLPKGRGSIRGILTKTFDGKEFAVKLNSPADLHFTKERCEFDGGEQKTDNPDGENPEPEGPSSDAKLLFSGGDFEDWEDFETYLNPALGDFAQKVDNQGLEDSNALHLLGRLSKNDFIFTAPSQEDMPAKYSKITFYLKGISEKSLSFNLYREDGSYYNFNLGMLESSETLSPVGSNRYGGRIDTEEKWILVILDISGLNDLNMTGNGDFIGLKVGNSADYNLYLDEFRIE